MRNLLFLSLTCFSRSGGIESYNKNWSHALQSMSFEGSVKVMHLSLHDKNAQPAYLDEANFMGCQGRKLKFIVNLFRFWKLNTTVVVGHLNLALPVWLIALCKPKPNIWVPLHGIECWQPLGYFKTWLCQQAQWLLPVSQFTWKKFLSFNHQFNAQEHQLLTNALDPFFSPTAKTEKPSYLVERYQLTNKGPYLLTLARYSYEEQYKGYDKIIQALPSLVLQYPSIKYILAGKADSQEQQRMQNLALELGVTNQIQWVGWVKQEELMDHYVLADAFVMPGCNEGFGIGYIEASACGTPALGSTLDGSQEALLQGETGYLVDPQQTDSIAQAIVHMLQEPTTKITERRQKAWAHFSFSSFSNQVNALLEHS